MDAMATRKDQTSRRRFLSGASALGRSHCSGSQPGVRRSRFAAVALANKTARIAWAMMKNGTEYQPKPVAR